MTRSAGVPSAKSWPASSSAIAEMFGSISITARRRKASSTRLRNLVWSGSSEVSMLLENTVMDLGIHQRRPATTPFFRKGNACASLSTRAVASWVVVTQTSPTSGNLAGTTGPFIRNAATVAIGSLKNASPAKLKRAAIEPSALPTPLRTWCGTARMQGCADFARSVCAKNLFPPRRQIFCEDVRRHRRPKIAQDMRPYLTRAIEQHNAVRGRLPLGIGQRIGLEFVRFRSDAGFGKIGVLPRILTAPLDINSGPRLARRIRDGRERRLNLIRPEQRLDRHRAPRFLVPDDGLKGLVRMSSAGIGVDVGRKADHRVVLERQAR